MKILHVAAELFPLLSTGGLAEVVSALPKALHARGHDVRVAIPCYKSVPEEQQGERIGYCEGRVDGRAVGGALRMSRIPDTEVPVYLIEHEGYFGREHPYGHDTGEYGDNAERYSFFCQALLDGLTRHGLIPDVLNCHDWHAAPVPVFLRTTYVKHDVWKRVPVVYTIHNLNFQGRFGANQLPFTGMDPGLFNVGCLEYYGDINLMKGAIRLADKLNTVSPRYAREIQTIDYGAGLDGVLRDRACDLSGILNGIDYTAWNPTKDPYTAEPFSCENLNGKAACKEDLQKSFNLPVQDVPLFGVVSRLSWQKGIDLILDAFERTKGKPFQLVLLGTGDTSIENQLISAAQRHPDKVAVTLRYDTALAHKVIAGSDFFLMPSRYEPCGLSQMYSFAYGTIPIVRRTGGLADSVRDVSRVHLRKGTATGISFVPMTSQALARAMERAFDIYADGPLLRAIRLACMREDFSWNRASHSYEALYRSAIRARA